MKKCTRCKEDKKMDQFSKWTPSWCRPCKNEYSRNYMKTTQRLNARRCHLRSTFGLTLEQWNELLVGQDHKCLICQRHVSEIEHPLCVDHDHKTNQVRGLLCRKCNSALGLFQDNPYILHRAFKHLEYKLPTSVAQSEKIENLCRPSQECEEAVDKKPQR